MAVAALALAACGKREPQVQAEAPLELTCAAFAGASGESLAARFGAANLSEETLPGSEGDAYQATVVFADERERRLEIVWADAAARKGVRAVAVSGEQSGWHGPAGIALGMSPAEVEAANGPAFPIAGFGWDMGGWASDWKGGVLGYAPCRVAVRFAPRGDYAAAAGEAQFSSDSAEIRAAEPRVMLISLGYFGD